VNPFVELHLALILFMPWFAILGGLFWFVPREPRTRARRVFDITTYVVAIAAFILAVRWGYAVARPTGTAGNIWHQVVATATGYGVFLGVMLLAWVVRAYWLRTRRG
jgi:ABC-type branched-subunit amino acid transport system permease subunit